MPAWPNPGLGTAEPTAPNWCEGAAIAPDPLLIDAFGNWINPTPNWPVHTGPITIEHDGTTGAPMFQWFYLNARSGTLNGFIVRVRANIATATATNGPVSLYFSDNDLNAYTDYTAEIAVVEAPTNNPIVVDITAGSLTTYIDDGAANATPAGLYDLIVTVEFGSDIPDLLAAVGADIDEAMEAGSTLVFPWWGFDCSDPAEPSSDCGTWITLYDLPAPTRNHPAAADSLRAAVDWLKAATGYRWNGICETTIRPPQGSNRCEPGQQRHGSIDLTYWIEGPINEIVEVEINGVIINPENYRLNRGRITPTRGVTGRSALIPWPRQNTERRLGDRDTWAVTVQHGEPVPQPLIEAAVELTTQFVLRADNSDECCLPDRVTSVSRDGITYNFDVDESSTVGIPTIDAIIKTFGRSGVGRFHNRMYDPAADYDAELW